MALSREEIDQIAKASAQTILEGIHRYAIEYKEPETVEQGLQDSMVEERTASDWYQKRAANAEFGGALAVSLKYREIMKEEEHHYDELNKELEDIRKYKEDKASRSGPPGTVHIVDMSGGGIMLDPEFHDPLLPGFDEVRSTFQEKWSWDNLKEAKARIKRAGFKTISYNTASTEEPPKIEMIYL